MRVVERRLALHEGRSLERRMRARDMPDAEFTNPLDKSFVYFFWDWESASFTFLERAIVSQHDPPEYVSRPGFTVKELIVSVVALFVLFVLFVLILLPAPRRAGEAAWRAQCTNNLKQI